jgi:hypothetical protein
MIRRFRLLLIASIFALAAVALPRAIAQTQYSIGNPTNEQQYTLELTNRARANGGAEAARLQGFSTFGSPAFSGGLQEGPPTVNGQVWTIENSVQPLSWNPLLATAAQNHANRLNTDDQFFKGGSPHTWGGSTPNSRIADTGYSMAPYNGPTNNGAFPGPENVAESVSFGSGPFSAARLIAEILNDHNALFTDTSVPGRGHRSTMMLAFFREMGVGISAGTDVGQDGGGTTRTWDSLYVVDNFGTQTGSTPFITGVVYEDTNGNGFYDPGEGRGGVRVDVAGANFFAISSSSGGYSVPVPGNGSFNVTFSGGGVTTTQATVNVANLRNAKADFVVGQPTGPTALANISTRLRVETGDNILIGGFILTGTQNKKVIIRAIGPSLSLAGKLANPTLELRNSSGALLASNDDWMNSSPADKQAIIDSTIPPSNDLESAIVATLPANGAGYTAIVRGANNTTGIAVVEVYDLDLSVDSRLANMSTRGFVQTGNTVLFAGMIVVGPGTQKVIVRAIGPSLTVPGKLGNPFLELRNSNGDIVRSNDDWRTGGQEGEIIASGVPPPSDFESALVETLSGGSSYTAVVRGVNNGTGIGLVEIYALQ